MSVMSVTSGRNTEDELELQLEHLAEVGKVKGKGGAFVGAQIMPCCALCCFCPFQIGLHVTIIEAYFSNVTIYFFVQGPIL